MVGSHSLAVLMNNSHNHSPQSSLKEACWAAVLCWVVSHPHPAQLISYGSKALCGSLLLLSLEAVWEG